jgi:hypothetical protein
MVLQTMANAEDNYIVNSHRKSDVSNGHHGTSSADITGFGIRGTAKPNDWFGRWGDARGPTG